MPPWPLAGSATVSLSKIANVLGDLATDVFVLPYFAVISRFHGNGINIYLMVTIRSSWQSFFVKSGRSRSMPFRYLTGISSPQQETCAGA